MAEAPGIASFGGCVSVIPSIFTLTVLLMFLLELSSKTVEFVG